VTKPSRSLWKVRFHQYWLALTDTGDAALRVEWCKAYARMRRWYEDVVLVEEEMGRTIQYGYWEAGEWLERSVA
jgi:hypothetical protein